MTVPNGSATSTASSIESLDSFARQLYRRARTAGHDFADIATVVRGLHTVLKHLRVEAEDPDSLLNTSPTGDNRNSLYARQLAPIVEDCDFTLKQLETILQKYGCSGDSTDDTETSPTESSRIRNGRKSKEVEEREKDMIALIRTKLANQKTNIDIFLDTVQLHNPVKARRALQNTDEEQLDAIKDQVDEIATRLFHRRGAVGSDNDEEELWQQFSTELEKAGFSSEVLRNNKEVLRAYIRELDSHDVPANEAPPSVRGLLGNAPPATTQPPPPMTIMPAPYSDLEAVSPKESFSRFDNEKFSPDVKNARPVPPPPQQHQQQHASGPPPLDPRVPQSLQPYHNRSQPPALYSQHSSRLSYEHHPSDSSDTDSLASQNKEMAVISTRELLTIDHRAQELMMVRMGNMHLGPPPTHPPNYSYTPGTNSRYLPSAPQPLPIMAGETPPALVPGHPLSSSPGDQRLLGSSPRYIPPYAAPPDYPVNALSPISSTMTPPPAYGSSPTSTTFPSSAPTSTTVATLPTLPQRYSSLAPDDKGNEIPLDAKWTRIKRTLVSPVVLEKAGVRYEARPEFVAVLGVISREQIEVWAKASADIRNSRRRDDRSSDRRPDRDGHREVRSDPRDRDRDRKVQPSPQPRRNETYHDHDRRRRKESESSDSESDVLWDESDTTEDEGRKRRHHRHHRPSSSRRSHSPESEKKDKERERDGSTNSASRFIPIPIIVPPPSSSSSKHHHDEKLSPTSVGPKPILKNRNTNHVRFDADGPREFSSEEMSRSADGRRRGQHRDRGDDRDRKENRDRDRERERERERSKRDDRDRSDRDRDRDRERDREHDRDREHRHHHHHRDRDRDRDRDRERDRDRDGKKDRPRDRDRDRDRERERDKEYDSDIDRSAKKSARRETLKAVGIGGAAASLLSVLTEAASGL